MRALYSCIYRGKTEEEEYELESSNPLPSAESGRTEHYIFIYKYVLREVCVG